MSTFYTLIGCGTLLATLILLAIRYGKVKEQNIIAEATQKANKDALQTAETIINHKPSSGIDKLAKLRKDRNS